MRRGIPSGVIYNGNNDEQTDADWLNNAEDHLTTHEQTAGCPPDNHTQVQQHQARPTSHQCARFTSRQLTTSSALAMQNLEKRGPPGVAPFNKQAAIVAQPRQDRSDARWQGTRRQYAGIFHKTGAVVYALAVVPLRLEEEHAPQAFVGIDIIGIAGVVIWIRKFTRDELGQTRKTDGE